jgi:ubiquitin-protein ligase
MSDSDSDNEYTFDSDSDEDTTLPDEMAMKQFTEQMNRQRFIEKFPNHRIWVDQLYEWNKLPPDNWIITMNDDNIYTVGFTLILDGIVHANFTLTVPIEKPTFPTVPPTLNWIGPKLEWSKMISMMYLEPLQPNKWNLCLNLNKLLLQIETYLGGCKIINEDMNGFTPFQEQMINLCNFCKIYPTTFKSDLPQFGIVQLNMEDDGEKKETLRKGSLESKGIGYSRAGEISWDLADFSKKEHDIEEMFQMFVRKIENDEFTHEELKILRFSSIIPFIGDTLSSSTQEILKHQSLYTNIYKLSLFIANNYGMYEIHQRLIKINGLIQNIVSRSKIEDSELLSFTTTVDGITVQLEIMLKQLYDNEEKSGGSSETKEDTDDKKKKFVDLNVGVPRITGHGKEIDEEKTSSTDEYIDLLKPQQLDFVDDFKTHIFSSKTGSASLNRKWMMRVNSEWTDMAEQLPMTRQGSIFMRWSEDNIQMFKFMIIPADDTPYSGGCFIFHMFIPTDYPASNPSVQLFTTGGGTVRFNPNLYVCGKVCLSLLGTWSGEKWDPAVSNIAQVLISILGLIFVEEPYFNEPGYQGTYGTPSGVKNSQEYNEDRQMNTIRWGVKDTLKNPPPEFASITNTHFKLQWSNLKKEYNGWVEKCKSEVRKKAMITMIAECDILVAKLK